MPPLARPPSADPAYSNDALTQMGQELETGSDGDTWLMNKGTKKGWAALKSGQNPICRYEPKTEVQFYNRKERRAFSGLGPGQPRPPAWDLTQQESEQVFPSAGWRQTPSAWPASSHGDSPSPSGSPCAGRAGVRSRGFVSVSPSFNGLARGSSLGPSTLLFPSGPHISLYKSHGA